MASSDQPPPAGEKPTANEFENRDTHDEVTDYVPRGYWKTANFIGTVFASGTALFGGTGGFALVAPILAIVNSDIGPSSSYVWVGLVNTLMIAVGSTLVGRLSDLFGRRWFIVLGSLLATVGCIVSSQAKTIPVLIGGNVLIGLAGAAQTSMPFVLGELVPMKHRYMVNGALYFFAIPTAGFGPAIAYAFVQNTSAGWRWCYYLMIITNGISTLCWFFFYHPPTFHMVSIKSRSQQLREFDYGGLVLFTGGLLIFLMGLNWGGTVYPWKSGYVIGTLVTGAVSLVAFVLYESFVPLKAPLIPMHLFRNGGWVANISVVALASSVYYGFSIVFPQMVFGIYTTDQTYGSILCCAITASFLLGVMMAGFSRHIGKQKYQMIACSIIFTPLLGGVACATIDNRNTVLGLLITGCIFVGYIEGCGVTSSSLSINNQMEIGAAVGVGATTRATVATFATTVYVVVLNARLTTTISEEVLPALAQTDLPAASYAGFISGLSTGSFTGVPGVTPETIAVGVLAFKHALILAFRTVFLTSIAFSGLVLILSCFFPNLDNKMTDRVTAILHETTTFQPSKSQKLSEVGHQEV